MLFTAFLMALSEPVTTVPAEMFDVPTARMISDHSSYTVEMTERLSGPDFKLMLEAYKHREMKGRDLSCYHIRIIRRKGVTTVAFLGNRPPVREVDVGQQTAIIFPGLNPLCPSKSFEMDAKGKVVRVVYSRH